MSLINDALKRATQTPSANAHAPAPDTPMEPVEKPASPGLPVYFTPILLCIISGACFFLLKGWESKRQAGLYPNPVTIHAREVSNPRADTNSTATASNRQLALNDKTTKATPATQTVPVAALPDPPKPEFRLQGIFYRATNPSAVVNSKTVFVGDTVDHAKVKSITRQSVTLYHDGETKVLT